ncbi:cellulose binding domain-containing protein [Actinoplanes sp. LDG1-06]|uniref:Cellulose binding domain-containing protein n=2 Tax=Paractinoplanes ovalisporus TaxID=2810368 RepID=A0ABS2AI71_9ACTN|nr:cellulose binding domain-containing protein [Actinoplanes ovalisporus]
MAGPAPTATPTSTSGPSPVPTTAPPPTSAPTTPAPPTPTSTTAPTTPAPPTPTPTGQPPSTPADLRVTAITPVSITLSWTASNPGTNPISGYTVNYTQAFNDIYWSQSVGNVTTVTLTSNIRATTQYRLSVSARDTENRPSPVSEGVTVITPASATGDTTPPSTPGNLRITAMTADGPALAWDAATDDTGVTGYNIYFFDGWFTSTLVGTTTSTSIVAPLLNSGLGLRSYYVRAKDAAGNLSIASNQVSPPPVTTPPPARTCRVTYRTTSEWTGGFVAEVTITNTGTTPVNGWSLAFTMPGNQRVATSWNAAFTQTGAAVTLTDAHWNARIPAGASVTAGLLGRWTTSNAAPTSFTLNNAPCD